MEDTTYLGCIQPGDVGDTPIELRLTIRELACLQLSLTIGYSIGAAHLSLLATEQHGVGETFKLNVQSAEARVGLALAAVLDPERKAEFSAHLARLDQERAELEEGV